MKYAMLVMTACLSITFGCDQSGTAGQPQSGDAEQLPDLTVSEAMAKLAEYRVADNRKDLERYLKPLRERMTAEPFTAWAAIVEPFLESPDAGEVGKPTIFRIALETADAATARSILTAAAQWSTLIDMPWPDRPKALSPNCALLCPILLESIASNTQWRPWTVDVPKLQAFLVNSGVGHMGLQSPQGSIATILSDVPLNSTVKSEIVENIILRSPQGGVWRGLYPFLNDDSISRIREALRRSIMGDGYIHSGALSVLLEIGDLATLPIFANRAEVKASLHSHQTDITIARWVEKIKVQHPPSQLLQWITDPARATAPTYPEALWAMNRAVELGVDRDHIRLAVLQLAENIWQQEAMAPVILYQIKSDASKLGLLHPDDLKDVVRPPLLDQLSRD